jgi:hypothetical protein
MAARSRREQKRQLTAVLTDSVLNERSQTRAVSGGTSVQTLRPCRLSNAPQASRNTL